MPPATVVRLNGSWERLTAVQSTGAFTSPPRTVAPPVGGATAASYRPN